MSEGTNIELKAIPFDFKRKTSWKDYSSLCEGITALTKDNELSMLINNVEQIDHYGSKIHKADDEEVLETMMVNTFPTVFMTRFLGPEMKKRSKKSAIINMTSYLAESKLLNAPVYSAASSFEDVFSQTLSYENPDIDILTVESMPVVSKKNPFGVSPEDTVNGVLNDLGYERISYGHWKHSLTRYYIMARIFMYGGPNNTFRRSW